LIAAYFTSIKELSLLIEGTVFRTHSGNYYVQSDNDGIVVCKLRGNLKKELIYSTSGSSPRRVDHANKRRSTDPLTVGDRVRLDSELAVIVETLPRHSELSRHSPSGRGQHTLVANLDQAFLFIAATHPAPDFWLLDRFLVLAEAADIPPRLIVNKVDRLTDEERPNVEAGVAVYEKIGYPVYWVSAKTGQGIEAVRSAMAGRISAVAGPSGVGKSSLLNALQPGLQLKTGEISNAMLSGRHTTTTAELLPLDGGGWVADTPGLRQVDFWEVERDQIQYCYPEFEPYLGECRFAGCRHHTELGCAVRAAVEGGEIDRRRYESYVQMAIG
jgi:ribosome biogenesis GTPase